MGRDNEQRMITRQQCHLHLTVFDRIRKPSGERPLRTSCLPPLKPAPAPRSLFVFFFTPYLVAHTLYLNLLHTCLFTLCILLSLL